MTAFTTLMAIACFAAGWVAGLFSAVAIIALFKYKEDGISDNEQEDIPECPKCKKPTKRLRTPGYKTAVFYPAMYDEKGVNTNPDRNAVTYSYTCLECGAKYEDT